MGVVEIASPTAGIGGAVGGSLCLVSVGGIQGNEIRTIPVISASVITVAPVERVSFISVHMSQDLRFRLKYRIVSRLIVAVRSFASFRIVQCDSDA